MPKRHCSSQGCRRIFTVNNHCRHPIALRVGQLALPLRSAPCLGSRTLVLITAFAACSRGASDPNAASGTPQATEEFRTLPTSQPAPTTALADTAQSTKTGALGDAADLIADDKAPLPFPTPGAELLYEDPGWDLVWYAGLLCLAERLALSGKDEAIARTIDLLEDLGGGEPPDNLQGFHDGLLAELRGLAPLASATAQRMAEEAFAQAEEHPLLAEVMSFPCELHYETIGQAMREASDMMEYGMPLCFTLEARLWNEEDALESTVGMLEREHWPENLRGLRDELVTALEALPEDASREMVEAVFEPVQAYPALMYAMPCIHSAGAGGIEFELGEAREEALLDYGVNVCGAWDVALEGGSDAKYGAIAILEAASPLHGLREFHAKLIAYLELLPDAFTENHAVKVFETVGVYPLLKDALHCELGDDVLILPQ